MEIETSFATASALRLSPVTPSLTASPTISSTTTPSPLLFPDFFPKDTWLPTDTAQWLLSPHHDLSPGVLLHSEIDVRPKKKSRHSPKLDHGSLEPSPPTIVSIPPAQACDIPLDLARKPVVRKRHSARSGRSKAAKRKEPSPPPVQQPVRFRFVSVQHAETSQPNVSAEFEEHMDDDVDEGPFEHGPSECPPRPYPGGEYAVSPLQPPPRTGKIPASSLDFLPVLEERFSRLEYAIEQYIQLRAENALRNSILPEATPEVTSSNMRQKTNAA